MSAEGFKHLACPNPDCTAYGQRGAGNLCLHGWSGRGQRIRCLRCTTCGTDFSERANTPLFGLRTAEDTLVAIAKHLAEGTGCRVMARGIEPKQIQPDEAWSFVGKKRQEL